MIFSPQEPPSAAGEYTQYDLGNVQTIRKDIDSGCITVDDVYPQFAYRTVLINAVVFNNIPMIQMLLQKYQPDTTIRDGYGRTALMYACINKSLDIVNLLLRYEAEVSKNSMEIVDNAHNTALILASIRPNDVNSNDICEQLLQHGALLYPLLNYYNRDNITINDNGVARIRHLCQFKRDRTRNRRLQRALDNVIRVVDKASLAINSPIIQQQQKRPLAFTAGCCHLL